MQVQQLQVFTTTIVKKRKRCVRAKHSLRVDVAISISPQTPDSELVDACLRSNPQAWQEFVRRFQPMIASVITKTLRQWNRPVAALVDDLVQETYLKLCSNDFKALRKFECRYEHSLAGFLKVVASNVTQDYLRILLSLKRGQGKVEKDIDGAIATPDRRASTTRLIEQHVLLSQIQSCLQKEYSESNFKRDCRILWLYYHYGFTARAISRSAGIGLSVKGVESALFRLTHLLKTRLRASA